MVLLQLSAVDIGQQTNGADGMFVDCIMVVHVELHLRDYPAKFGDKSSEDSGFIHPAQNCFRVARRC